MKLRIYMVSSFAKQPEGILAELRYKKTPQVNLVHIFPENAIFFPDNLYDIVMYQCPTAVKL